MNTKTFFTLGEYKQNYEKIKTEFVEAYEDNDEEEFISLQIEWYQKCLTNTEVEWTVSFDGDIDWFPKVFFNDSVIMWEVIEKIRNENGGMNPTAAQNLNVSFSKIIRFLLQKKEPTAKLAQAQLALYYYILHDQKLVPRFQRKVKEIEGLSAQYGLNAKNLQLKYNEISNTKGQEGYSKDDVVVVKQLLEKNYPSALDFLEELTQHIY